MSRCPVDARHAGGGGLAPLAARLDTAPPQAYSRPPSMGARGGGGRPPLGCNQRGRCIKRHSPGAGTAGGGAAERKQGLGDPGGGLGGQRRGQGRPATEEGEGAAQAQAVRWLLRPSQEEGEEGEGRPYRTRPLARRHVPRPRARVRAALLALARARQHALRHPHLPGEP